MTEQELRALVRDANRAACGIDDEIHGIRFRTPADGSVALEPRHVSGA
jgi:hypothetical protein